MSIRFFDDEEDDDGERLNLALGIISGGNDADIRLGEPSHIAIITVDIIQGRDLDGSGTLDELDAMVMYLPYISVLETSRMSGLDTLLGNIATAAGSTSASLLENAGALYNIGSVTCPGFPSTP